MEIDGLVIKYEKELELVEPRFHGQFVQFAETGEASRGFMDYLDESRGAQRAFEMISNREIREFNEKVKGYEQCERLKLVEPRFHGQFVQFAETGEASKEFMDYLGKNREVQRAVEMEFKVKFRFKD
ncbi:hypothetical protein GOV03_03640 [Candidatus Woesearchaeota archaeon]|nr:hypothetical protein [Candidatus Woesearchaeota archaeon]